MSKVGKAYGPMSQRKWFNRRWIVRSTGAALAACALSTVFSASGFSDNADGQKIEDARFALEKWVDTQRVISQEKRDFAEAKEMLNERINLVKQEIDTLHGKIGDAKDSIAQADKDREKLIEENERLKNASVTLQDILNALESRTRKLLARLPAPIQERVKPLSQQIPEDPKDAKLSMSVRFQNVVGILNEINKFNREITVTSEVRDLPDGKSAEVTTLYLGIGQAFYTDAKGTIAGVGRSSEDGWVWEPANESAPQIASAIAILNNEQVASFVPVPVKIQ